MDLLENYLSIRNKTELLCRPLQTEDYVVQPIVDVSPPKWHLGHTSWFFETFVLKVYIPEYKEFDEQYNFVFNSYYETLGARVVRTDRGNLSRPSVDDVYKYRKYIDEQMTKFLNSVELSPEMLQVITLGLNHEQQHQELLYTDIKYILGHNPLMPAYSEEGSDNAKTAGTSQYLTIDENVYEIGYDGDGFCFDNELERHKVYLTAFQIADSLVSNSEFLEFINSGGYENFKYWHADGWDWVRNNKITSPLYWHLIDGKWVVYTLQGLRPLKSNEAVCHVSYYEASAYAAWKGVRLPTEAEWEVASGKFKWGDRWEWTESAYLPYPGFKKAAGAIGEYNGKFMINQMVLRGASVATAAGHSRPTYRNFFQPQHRWQFTGIRLAR